MKREKKMAKKIFEGTVVSNKMQKTVTVAVEVFKKHSVYGRSVRNTRKFKARNEDLKLEMGDFVAIEECKPYSKEVTWKVIEKLEAK